jgi:hypothetical protein
MRATTVAFNDRLSFIIKLISICFVCGFLYSGQWQYAVLLVPVFLVDACLPNGSKANPFVNMFKFYLIFQGVAFWFINSSDLFSIPLHNLEMDQNFQKQVVNANNMLRGVSKMTIDSMKSLTGIDSGFSITHSHSVGIRKYDGLVFPVKIESNSGLHPEMNALSRDLIGKTFGQLFPTNFPDLRFHSKAEVQRRFSQIFSELPEKGFDPSFKNPCWNRRNIHEDDASNLRREGLLVCLPYAYLLGQPKSGTTDLFERIGNHPDIRYEAGYLCCASKFSGTNFTKLNH